MTVSELIDYLQQFDDNTPVILNSEDLTEEEAEGCVLLDILYFEAHHGK